MGFLRVKWFSLLEKIADYGRIVLILEDVISFSGPRNNFLYKNPKHGKGNWTEHREMEETFAGF